MKSKCLFILLLFCSCTNNKFYGHVYDYDTEQPIQNVTVKSSEEVTQTDSMGCFRIKVKSNLPCTIYFEKEGYASKKIFRKPDSLGNFSKKGFKNNSIYMFNTESEFLTKINN